MNKGLTLIETILYITLLSIMISGIFSSLYSFLQSKINGEGISKSDYELLMTNFHE
jgi:hypothetical protein